MIEKRKPGRPKRKQVSTVKTKAIQIKMTESFFECWDLLSQLTGLYKSELFHKAMMHTFGIQEGPDGIYRLPEEE